MLARSLLPWCVSTISIGVFGAGAANAACVIQGARPTVALPTMAAGQEFSFVASRDCDTLRFTIRGTTVSKIPSAVGPMGPGLRPYRVVLTEREWDAVAGGSGPTLTWVVTGRTSTGVMTRMNTTNELKLGGGVEIDLSMADAKLVGKANDGAGTSISGAGDVDGDGHDDVLVGAWGAHDYAGAAYLVLGPVTGTLDLSGADATLVGEAPVDFAGQSVSGAGDVNDDGHDDLLIGAYWNDAGGSDAGAAYLVLGPVTGTLDLALADAKLVGEESGDGAGVAVSDAGDVNADGRADILIASFANDEGSPNAGAAYLLLGPVTGTLDLSLADAKLVGEPASYDYSAGVSGVGDADGDGHDDLLVSDNYAGRGAWGAAYLVLGPVTGTVDLSLADAKLVGEELGDQVSYVSGAADMDGDGHDDLLIGAPRNDEGGRDAGAAYLVLSPVTGRLNLSLADAKLVGEDSDDLMSSVSSAGDVDNDGHDDLLVAAYGNDEGGSDAGAAYLVLGPVTGTVDLSLADAKLVGEEAGDMAAFADAGDLDGDGRADILVGAPGNDEGGSEAGAAYVFYGGGL